MRCRKCKSKMLCKDSRHVLDGQQVIRRYVCSKCSSNTYTMEKPISFLEFSDNYKLIYKEGANG